jgi:hypothetical protein
VTPEGAVLRACLELLQIRGVLAWRSNNAPRLISAKGSGQFARFAPSMTPGLPDVLGVLPGGRLLAVECKAERGRLSDSQSAFLAALERAGAVALVARSASELDEAIAPYLEPRGASGSRRRSILNPQAGGRASKPFTK